MIHEVDEALRTLIKRDALRGTEVEVVFDAPTKDWSSRRNAPTADVYLYDIREDMRRRGTGRFELPAAELVGHRREDERVTSRAQPPRWYKLSYLITAWTQRPEDEHRLLAAMLRCFLQFDAIPRDVLAGSLSGIVEAIPVTCALPPPEDRALSDVWSALGGELKPSLDLVVTVPFDLTMPIEVGPPVLEGPRLSVAPVSPAEVRAHDHGRGRRGSVAAATATAGASAAGGAASGGSSGPTGHHRGAGGEAPEGEAAPVQRPVAAEERVAGAEGRPGRRFRITELPR